MGRGQSVGSNEGTGSVGDGGPGAAPEVGEGEEAGTGTAAPRPAAGTGTEAVEGAGQGGGDDDEHTEVTGFNLSTETVTALSRRRILKVFSDLSKTGNGPS